MIFFWGGGGGGFFLVFLGLRGAKNEVFQAQYSNFLHEVTTA